MVSPVFITPRLSAALQGQLQVRGMTATSVDDMPSSVGGDVHAVPGHHRAEQTASTDDETHLLAWMEGQADGQQVNFDVDHLT